MTKPPSTAAPQFQRSGNLGVHHLLRRRARTRQKRDPKKHGSDKRVRRNHLRQAGLTLIEMLVTLGIVAALMTYAVPYIMDAADAPVDAAVARDLATYDAASRAYATTYHATIESNIVGNGGNPVQVGPAALQATGFLSNSFAATNPLGQSYVTWFRRPQAGQLEVLPLAAGAGVAMTDARIGGIVARASELGANALGLQTGSTTLTGLFGSWTVPIAPYTAAGASIPAGSVGAMSLLNGGALTANWLSRTVVDGNAQANTWSTNELGGGNDTTGWRDITATRNITTSSGYLKPGTFTSGNACASAGLGLDATGKLLYCDLGSSTWKQASAGASTVVVAFGTPGSFSFTVPAGFTKIQNVVVTGAGGNGGGFITNGCGACPGNGGTGGGGGGTAYAASITVAAGDVLTGWTGGSGSLANQGGGSSQLSAGGRTLVGNGGSGGTSGVGGAVGAGGTASGGDTNYPGGDGGGVPTAGACNRASGGGGGGAGGTTGAGGKGGDAGYWTGSCSSWGSGCFWGVPGMGTNGSGDGGGGGMGGPFGQGASFGGGMGKAGGRSSCGWPGTTSTPVLTTYYLYVATGNPIGAGAPGSDPGSTNLGFPGIVYFELTP